MRVAPGARIAEGRRSLAFARIFQVCRERERSARVVLVLPLMPTRAKVTRIPPPPISETTARARPPSLDPDAEALLLVAKMMNRARVAKGVAKIAVGMLAGAASRTSAELLDGRYRRVLHVARAAAQAASHVAATRTAAQDDHLGDDERASCVDVA